MKREQTYITDGEKINCQKVADAFEGQFDSEDLIILNAGRYGFVKLQYFKFPFGFDTVDSYYESKSLFDELWQEWLHTQLLSLSAVSSFTAERLQQNLKKYEPALHCRRI